MLDYARNGHAKRIYRGNERAGDIVISHMNRPGRGTSEGYAAALPRLVDRGVRFVRLREGFA